MPEFFNNFNWEIFKKPNQSFRNVDYDPNAELNWDAHDWLSQRAENDRGPKYTEQDVEIFNSHIPEYKQIEQNSKSNGTWLQMPDGSRWVGDPREWVMMQSEAFKKNYQENPWYTGQAEWETQVTLPDGTVIDTDKVKRARYHNGEMWFSNDAGYAQYFADTVGREGLGVRGQFINNPNYKTDHNIKGTVFLAGIPKTGNYRKLEGPKTGYDHWRHMPFILTETGFERTNEKTNLLTDDLVSHSRKLGDDGLFLFNVNDGPVLRNKYKENKMVPYFARPGHMNNDPNSRLETAPINEFISQPGFTEKIKFIRGNNGNFDPNTNDKYSAIFKIDSPLFAKKGGRIHIKKKNRGSFTRWCKGEVTEECIRRGKNSSNPAIRKKATFASNSRRWKHENGGILKYQNPSSPLLPAAIKIGYTYKPDISRSTEVEGATPIMDLQELSKKEKRGLYEAYDFYANDVYPRKQKYNGSYNPKIHNMDNLTKRVIFREPLNFKNGFNRGGYAPIYLPSESSQITNFLTPIVTRKPRDFGNTVLHEATHAEDGDSFKTDNFKLGESMTDEEVKLLDEAYKFEYEDDMTRAEKQTTNREFRFGLSRLTGLYLDDLTDYINNLSTKELKKLYKKINPGYRELMIKPKYDDNWRDAVKKALIQVGQNTTDQNRIDYKDPVTFAKNGGILKAQEGTTEGFWSKLWNAVKEGGMAARDAKLGAVGAQQVRDLYSEGKNQEAQDLAKQYAKANTTGIALAGGAASTGLLGDLMVTGATTAADTFIDGNIDNFGKNLSLNVAFDLAGHGVGKLLRNVDWSKVRNSVELIPNNTKVDVSEYINTVDDALPERQPLTIQKSPQFLSYDELDDMYFRAINDGDSESIRQIQNIVWKRKAPNSKLIKSGNPIHLLHGTTNGLWTKIDPAKYSDDGISFFLTNEPEVAWTYKGVDFEPITELPMDIERGWMLDSGEWSRKIEDFRADGYDISEQQIKDFYDGKEVVIKRDPSTVSQKNKIFDFYVNSENPLVIHNKHTKNWNNLDFEGMKTTRDISKYAKDHDYTSVTIENIYDHGPFNKTSGSLDNYANDVTIVHNPKLIKSADLITYDDSGNIIPISKRFDFNINDIRWGFTPLFLGLGAAKTVSNNTKEQQ